MHKWVLYLRIFLWTALGVVIFVLFYLGVVPSGHIAYEWDFGKTSEFIGKFTPSERVEIQDGGVKILGDPVYFSLRTPRRFDKVNVSLKYKSSDDLKLIEMGPLVDKTVWRHDLRPIENKTIDQLDLAWSMTEDGDSVLLQRDGKYQSLEEFLAALRAGEVRRDGVALYNYDIDDEFVLAGYQADEETREYDYALRGAYEFYTYIKDEDLSFSFNIVDLNLNKDPDKVDVNLYYNGSLIDTRHLDDDGISKDSGERMPERILDFKLANLPEGVYKLEFKTNDDIVTKKIITSASKLAFINKIYLLEDGERDIQIYSDAIKIGAMTVSPASLQTIHVGDKDLVLDETYKLFDLLTSSSSSVIELEKDGVILSGDGVFSFFEEDLINPSFRKVNEVLDINKMQIDYVLASYTSPSEEGEWRLASVEYDINNAYREFYKYGFLISAPGLRAEDSVDDWIVIDEIKVEYEGTSLAEKIRKLIKK